VRVCTVRVGGNSLNRATGWNLARKLKLRLQKRADGDLPPAAIDVVVRVTHDTRLTCRN